MGVWDSYGGGNFRNLDYTTDNLAAVILDSFGIPHSDTNIVTGGLRGLDIKRLDALQAIRLTLLEIAAGDKEENGDIGGKFYEPIVNPQGVVEFKLVYNVIHPTFYFGFDYDEYEIPEKIESEDREYFRREYDFDDFCESIVYDEINDPFSFKESILSSQDIYYELQSSVYRSKCNGVLITGQKPLPRRYLGSTYNIKTIGDIQETGIIHGAESAGVGINTHSTLMLLDPQKDKNYSDSVVNLSRTNPFVKIVGYAVEMDGVDSEDDVVKAGSTKVVVPIGSSLGSLIERQKFTSTTLAPDTITTDYNSSGGLPISLPYDSDGCNFSGVTDVFVWGRNINNIYRRIDGQIIASINRPYNELIRLSRGTHYIISYNNNTPSISFIDNSRTTQDPFGGNQSFIIDPLCDAADASVSVSISSGNILPTSENQGILVGEIYVTLEYNNPSLVAFSNSGKSSSILSNIDYTIRAIKITNFPSPIAYNGTVVNQADQVADQDPTTIRSFRNTEMERVMDAMIGNGLTLSFSFLNRYQVCRLSRYIYDFLNEEDGVETTYVCAPGTEVELGDYAPSGGVVNSITYSYQDQSSYTISVNAGSKVVGGFAQISGERYIKKTENDSGVAGTVVMDIGDGGHYMVHLDGYGLREALNMTHSIIRVGDKVQCTVNNNPVED